MAGLIIAEFGKDWMVSAGGDENGAVRGVGGLRGGLGGCVGRCWCWCWGLVLGAGNVGDKLLSYCMMFLLNTNFNVHDEYVHVIVG